MLTIVLPPPDLIYSFIAENLYSFIQPFPVSPIPPGHHFPTICFHEFDFLKKIVHASDIFEVLVFVDLLWINKVSEFITHLPLLINNRNIRNIHTFLHICQVLFFFFQMKQDSLKVYSNL